MLASSSHLHRYHQPCKHVVSRQKLVMAVMQACLSNGQWQLKLVHLCKPNSDDFLALTRIVFCPVLLLHLSFICFHTSLLSVYFTVLLCEGDVREVPVHWGVHEDVYCAGKESTFQFLEGVLKEVISLFPSQYIHIGGDEVPPAHTPPYSLPVALYSS